MIPMLLSIILDVTLNDVGQSFTNAISMGNPLILGIMFLLVVAIFAFKGGLSEPVIMFIGLLSLPLIITLGSPFTGLTYVALAIVGVLLAMSFRELWKSF